MTAGFDPTYDVWDPTLGEIYGTDATGEITVTKEVNVVYVLNSFNTNVTRIATIAWNDQSNYSAIRSATISWNEASSIAFINSYRLNWTDRKKVTLTPVKVVWTDYAAVAIKRTAILKWNDLASRLKTATGKWTDRNRVLWARTLQWDDHPKPPTFPVFTNVDIGWNSISHILHKPYIIWNTYGNALHKADLRYRIGKIIDPEVIIKWNTRTSVPVQELATLLWTNNDNVIGSRTIEWVDNKTVVKSVKLKYRDELRIFIDKTIIFNDTINVTVPVTIVWDNNQTVIGTTVTMRWSQTNPIIIYTDNRVYREPEINNVEVRSIQGPNA